MANFGINDFSAHGQTASIAEMFADRDEQRQVFADSLAAHRTRLDTDDISGVRRENVLVFAGSGGIGKTALSRRLERWITGQLPHSDDWGPKPETVVAGTARIDLHDQAGAFDPLGALVEIRTAMSSTARTWPAFDLAFAAYWSALRPGAPLPLTRDRDARFADATAAFLEDLAGDLGSLNTATSLASMIIRRAVLGFRHRLQIRASRELDADFDALLESCLNRPTEAEPHLELAVSIAAQLTIRIDEIPPEKRPLVVVFVDTFERLRADPRHHGERLLNQLVYTLPHILFVVTGRDLLSWSDAFRSELYRCGPAIWPGLAPLAASEPRQHLFGNLSEADARAVITRFWHSEQLPLDAELVEQLVKSSGGWPLYLDVAIELARTVRRNGGTSLAMADVTGSLGQLVLRVMDDMPADERESLRAACLLPFFNTDLVSAGAQTTHGAVERLGNRALVADNHSTVYPYRVHDEIRSVIRRAGHLVEGGWSEHDWRDAASRELDLISRYIEDASGRDDYAGVTNGVILGLHLMSDTGMEPDWMPRVLINAPSIAALAAGMPRVASTERTQMVLDFLLARAGEPDMAAARESLRTLADKDSIIAAQARRHYAYRLRNAGRWNEAIDEFTKLIELEKPELHRFQRVITLMMARRFQEANDRIPELSPQYTVRAHAAALWSHGVLEPWLEAQRGVLHELDTRHAFREIRESSALYLRRLSWVDGSIIPAAERELELCEQVGHRIGVKTMLCTLALLHAGDQDVVLDLTTRLQAITDRSAEDPITYRIAEPMVLDAFVRDDDEAAARARDYTNRHTGDRDRFWIPTEILLEEMGAAPEPTIRTQWLEPYPIVRARWLDLAHSIRIRAGY